MRTASNVTSGTAAEAAARTTARLASIALIAASETALKIASSTVKVDRISEAL